MNSLMTTSLVYSFREIKLRFMGIRKKFKQQDNMTLFIPRKEFNIKSGLGIFQSVGKRELSGHYTSQGLR